MQALAEARETDEEFRFVTNGEHPVIRLARIVGEPTISEKATLASSLANLSMRDWRRAESGLRETYLARADLILSLLAESAMGLVA
jgi:hypothetical protein